MKGKRTDCARRITADAFELQQPFGIFRESSAIAGHRFTRNAVQLQRTDIIAEWVPAPCHFRQRSAREVLHGGVLAQPFTILGEHPVHLRLLKHDLRDQNVVGIGGLPPWQIAAVPGVPFQQESAELPFIGRRYGDEAVWTRPRTSLLFVQDWSLAAVINSFGSRNSTSSSITVTSSTTSPPCAFR